MTDQSGRRNFLTSREPFYFSRFEDCSAVRHMSKRPKFPGARDSGDFRSRARVRQLLVPPRQISLLVSQLSWCCCGTNETALFSSAPACAAKRALARRRGRRRDGKGDTGDGRARRDQAHKGCARVRPPRRGRRRGDGVRRRHGERAPSRRRSGKVSSRDGRRVGGRGWADAGGVHRRRCDQVPIRRSGGAPPRGRRRRRGFKPGRGGRRCGIGVGREAILPRPRRDHPRVRGKGAAQADVAETGARSAVRDGGAERRG